MKNFKYPLAAFALVAILASCNNANSGKSKTLETQSQEVTNESVQALNDTVTGRGCFEIVTEVPYDIPAQRFDETAQALAHTSGCFIETDLAETGSVQVNAINGKMSIRDAILTAIDGTSLKISEETEARIKVELISSN